MIKQHTEKSMPNHAKKALAKLLLAAALWATMMAGIGFGTNEAHASTTFTVNTTADTLDANPGDGFCLTGTAQACTLRAAVQEANVTPGADTIDFNIFGTGVKTIKIDSNGNGNLPKITDPVTIDGPWSCD
jgi:CSLREA domain-containing protein